MSYYRGDKVIRPSWNDVIQSFINGKLLHISKYGEKSETSLEMGATKYNIEYARKFQELSDQFHSLMAVESSLIRILEDYNPKANLGTTRNIYHILTAQKGTRSILNCIVRSLKTYKVKDAGLLKALQEEFDMTNDRLRRNKDFLSEFAIEAGMGKLIKYIESKVWCKFICLL